MSDADSARDENGESETVVTAEVVDAGARSGAQSEPIEAEFEPAGGPWRGLLDRQITLPLAAAAGAALLAGLLGGLLASALSGRGAGPASGRIEAAIDARLAPYDERLRALRQELAGAAGQGGDPAAAALADFEAELGTVRDSLAAAEKRLGALETASSSGSGRADPALAQRLDALAADVAAAREKAEQALAAPQTQSQALAQLEERVGKLDQGQAALDRGMAQLSAGSTALARRVTGAPAPRDLATAGPGAALAFAALEDAALSGRPFATEAAEARDYFGDDEHMQALAALAANGAPTPGTLASRFRAAAGAARAAEQPAGGGLVDQMGRAVAGLVTVRRLDAPQTDTTGDVLVRAQRRLSDGRIDGAVAELERLQGPARAAVDPWITEARARVEIEAQLEALRQSFGEK